MWNSPCAVFFFVECAIDGLRLFWFSQKIVHAHIPGRQNKNKLKEKHAKSSEQLVNRIPTSIYTSFISVDFEKNMPNVEQSDVQIKGQLLPYNFLV